VSERPRLPEPAEGGADAAGAFVGYLDFYRETAVAKASSLSEDELHTSRLPTGWTPLELVNHLAFMERRWFVWGFLGEQVDEPWGDTASDRWAVPAGDRLDAVVARLRASGRRTTDILTSSPLERRAATGGRFDTRPPTLMSICFHVLQEYARHIGHLDVAVELAGGGVGE
jgi:uncharacterized damage-inducible protein DinB